MLFLNFHATFLIAINQALGSSSETFSTRRSWRWWISNANKTHNLLLSVFEVETEKTSDYNNEESRANRKKHHHILNTVLSTDYIEKDGRKLSQRHLLKSYMNFCNPNLLKETTFSLPLDASSSLVAGRHILHRNFIKLQWLAFIFHLAWNDLNKVSFH